MDMTEEEKLAERRKYPYFGGIYIAVFNCHECDKRKGRKAVLGKFGLAGWAKVKRINRTGVMAMFKVDPAPETMLYAETVGMSADRRWMKQDPEGATCNADGTLREGKE